MAARTGGVLTIGAALAGRGKNDNALNFLRLVLASMVILGHTLALGGFERNRIEGLSGYAVNGFFAISGYLIAGSRSKLDLPNFVWRRCLRILPGLWACLLVIAFVISPLSAWFSGESWHLDSAVGYFVHNFVLDHEQRGIDATLVSNPTPDWANQLWTLTYEFMGYMGAGFLLAIAWVRRTPGPVLLALTLLTMVVGPLAHGPLHVTSTIYLVSVRLGGFFLAGMALWAFRDRVPARWPLTLAAAAVVVVVYFAPIEVFWMEALTPLPIAYLLISLGGLLRVRVGSRNDISYGVYIYGMAMQQVLALAGGHALGILLFALVSFAMTVPLAWASWLLVERPALRLAHRRPRGAQDRAQPPASVTSSS